MYEVTQYCIQCIPNSLTLLPSLRLGGDIRKQSFSIADGKHMTCNRLMSLSAYLPLSSMVTKARVLVHGLTRPDQILHVFVGKTMRRNALEESRLLEATSCEDVSEVLDLRVR